MPEPEMGVEKEIHVFRVLRRVRTLVETDRFSLQSWPSLSALTTCACLRLRVSAKVDASAHFSRMAPEILPHSRQMRGKARRSGDGCKVPGVGEDCVTSRVWVRSARDPR